METKVDSQVCEHEPKLYFDYDEPMGIRDNSGVMRPVKQCKKCKETIELGLMPDDKMGWILFDPYKGVNNG